MSDQENNTDRGLRRIVAELAVAATRLVGIGLIGIGVSGILALGMGAVAGRAFVAGDGPGVTYTAARCRDFFEYAPHATSCAQAAAIHHFNEVVWYRVAAGVFGGLVFATTAWLRRRRERTELLPETLIPTIAATSFAIGGIWLTGQGIDLMVHNTKSGGGAFLSAGAVALALAASFTIPVSRALEVRLPPTAPA